MNAQNFSLPKYQDELKSLLAQTIKLFDRFGVSYFGLYGTCLGAVRHQDIIPWDDDVDLGVRRCDYHKAREIIERECPDLYFWDWDVDPKCCLSFGRIFRRIKNGDTIEKKRAYIDLYIIDEMPNNVIMRTLHKLCYTVIGRHIIRRCRAKIEYKTFTFSSILIYWLGVPLHLFSANFLRACYSSIKGMFNGSGKKYVSIGGLVSRSLFVNSSRVSKFGNVEIRIPTLAEDYLVWTYGDWRRLPPVDQRGEHAYKRSGEVIAAMPEDLLRG